MVMLLFAVCWCGAGRGGGCDVASQLERLFGNVLFGFGRAAGVHEPQPRTSLMNDIAAIVHLQIPSQPIAAAPDLPMS